MTSSFVKYQQPSELTPAIIACVEAWDYWPLKEFKDALATGNYTLFARICDGVCSGVLLVVNLGDAADVVYIYTEPRFRRQGLALQLLRECERTLKSDGLVQKLFLEVRPDNGGAQKLYESFQMQLIGTRKNYYKDGSDALVYRKVLQRS